MEKILEFMKTDLYLIVISITIIILLFLYLLNRIKLRKINRNYNEFMRKIGKGENIQETIEQYFRKIDEVQKENIEIKNYCKELDHNMMKCIQKIGIIRYNAFKDTGSDLSFTLALLDEENTGVVLNGIYSREVSNIYAKPIEKGISKYTLSDEEEKAIKRAVEMK